MLSLSGHLWLEYSHVKIYCMQHIPSTTPGFVLTSLSFRKTENKTTTIPSWQQAVTENRSSIAKFDYCLPPEELNNGDQEINAHAA